MLGHELITAVVTTEVRNRLPRVMAARAAVKAPDLPVPTPETDYIYPHALPAQDIGGYPCLMVEELETGPRYTTRQQAPSGNLDVFEIRYLFRVWCYVRGQDYKHTAYRQKYMATSLRMALLEQRCLRETEEERAVIDPATVRESFSNVDTDDDAQKYLAGHYIEFEIVSEETLRPSNVPEDVAAVFSLQGGYMERTSTEPIPPTMTSVTEAQ